MSVPVLSMATSRCWMASRDPTNEESVKIELGNFWYNTSSLDFFQCLDQTPASLVWKKLPATAGIQNFPTLPVISGSTQPGTATYSVQVGKYEKIGNQIFATIALTWSSHTGTGNMLISNLPFSVANTVQANPISLQNITLPVLSFGLVAVSNGSTTLSVMADIVGQARSPVLMSAAGSVNLSMRYFI